MAALFTATYISAALSAPFAGLLADMFGRRAACLVFCGIHSLASTAVLFDRLEILVLGRILGGVGLTLLWTVFETWMVAEYENRGLGQTALPITAMFGTMTVSSCITATLAGVVANGVVLALGSKAYLFGVSIVSSHQVRGGLGSARSFRVVRRRAERERTDGQGHRHWILSRPYSCLPHGTRTTGTGRRLAAATAAAVRNNMTLCRNMMMMLCRPRRKTAAACPVVDGHGHSTLSMMMMTSAYGC